MTTTRRTLLARVRDRDDADAWGQFYELYAPLLLGYARRVGLSADDAEEVRDQCLELIARKMPTFEYDTLRGGFQGWLHTLARGKVVDFLRRRRAVARGESGLLPAVDPAPGPDSVWEQGWRAEHLRFGLAKAKERVRPDQWEAFRMLLEDGRSVPEVEAALSMNANQVYKAKGRVLREVRRVLDRLGVEGE